MTFNLEREVQRANAAWLAANGYGVPQVVNGSAQTAAAEARGPNVSHQESVLAGTPPILASIRKGARPEDFDFAGRFAHGHD